MRAVVFDFFGTLTDPSAEAGRLASFTTTAATLGVPADAFATTMAATFRERATGAFGDTRASPRPCGRWTRGVTARSTRTPTGGAAG